jgi:hypothetical protein
MFMAKIYKFVLSENLNIHIPHEINIDTEWLHLENGFGYIKKGYAWDGCTPKFKLFGKVFGTPDGKIDEKTGKPQTYFASATHDVLYQYKKEIDISRHDADWIFLCDLSIADFKYSLLYFCVVRLFGGFFGRWKI